MTVARDSVAETMGSDAGADRSRLIETLFTHAIDMKAAERAKFLDSACGTDLTLRAEIESLLAADSSDDHFITAAVSDIQGKLVTQPGADLQLGIAGSRIGPYRIVECVGKGGMGEVYRSVREDQFHMQVALKVVKHGADADLAVSQFQREREILARLDHVNIARLLDGGATSDGLPYFVMEYVEGQPIIDYCRGTKLGIGGRLHLFRSVCAAVQYAHQSLIVHRDLKPGNILITAGGIPKLLDFGIAKLLEPSSEAGMLSLTSMGIHAMTPDYASPEQIAGLPLTTATDIYSLGVILYEILTFHRPYRSAATTRAEIERAISQEAPIDPRTVSKQIDRDLANIVLMALRKEPARRYSSVEQFSDDVRRYLEGRPVVARKDTLPYRCHKFVQRHKIGVAFALAIAIGTAAGVSAVRREAVRAQRRFEQVRKLAHTMLFDFHDQIAPLPGATNARQLLVRTALEYLDSLASEAGSDARLQLEVGMAYEKVGDVQGSMSSTHLGQPQAAVESYRKGLAIAGGLPPSRPVLELMVRLYHKIGDAQDTLLGQPTEARRSMQMALQIADSIPAKTGDPAYQARAETAYWMGGLDMLRDINEHRRWMEKSAAIAHQWAVAEPGPTSALFELITLRKLGDVLWQTGALQDAMSRLLDGTRQMERLLQQQPENGDWLRELALFYERAGLVAGHPMYFNLGDHTRAARLLEKMSAIYERLAAADATDVRAHFDLSEALAELASTLRETDKVRAEGLYRRSLALNATIVQTKPQDRLAPRWQAFNRAGLAWLLAHNGRHREAVEELQKAIAIQETYVHGDPADLLYPQELAAIVTTLGSVLTGSHDNAAATAQLNHALALLTPLWQANPRKLTLLRDLANCYEMFGNASAAEKDWPGARTWYAKSRELWERWPSIGISSVYDTAQRKRLTALLEHVSRQAQPAGR
jgi:tetratricopeptide (TPR) repeat protein